MAGKQQVSNNNKVSEADPREYNSITENHVFLKLYRLRTSLSSMLKKNKDAKSIFYLLYGFWPF